MLNKNTFTLDVELQISQVSCPGVWLCPYGRLSLEVYMMDTCVQTGRIKPFFPLDFNEKYIFHKTFDGSFDQCLVNCSLDDENVYIELIQWECDGLYGGVLASFRCALEELLSFPIVETVNYCKNNDVELLMQPSKSFPGILSPKIEISTATTVREGISSLTNMTNDAYLTKEYGTSRSRAPSPSRKVQCQLRQTNGCTLTQRQRQVCHSTNYHKSRKCIPKIPTKKPVFSYRKPDCTLIMRQVQGLGSQKCCCCNEYSNVANLLRDRMIPSADDIMCECTICNDLKRRPMRKIDQPSMVTSSICDRKCLRGRSSSPRYPRCLCTGDHIFDTCNLCAKYLHYFDSKCCSC